MQLLFAILISIVAAADSASIPYRPGFLGQFAGSKLRKSSGNYETRYFRQRLDHFSFAELPEFSQRYLLSPAAGLWAPPAPIFFYCGNEGDIEWFSDNTGFVWEIAPRFSALVVFAEVRYF